MVSSFNDMIGNCIPAGLFKKSGHADLGYTIGISWYIMVKNISKHGSKDYCLLCSHLPFSENSFKMIYGTKHHV